MCTRAPGRDGVGQRDARGAEPHPCAEGVQHLARLPQRRRRSQMRPPPATGFLHGPQTAQRVPTDRGEPEGQRVRPASLRTDRRQQVQRCGQERDGPGGEPGLSHLGTRPAQSRDGGEGVSEPGMTAERLARQPRILPPTRASPCPGGDRARAVATRRSRAARPRRRSPARGIDRARTTQRCTGRATGTHRRRAA